MYQKSTLDILESIRVGRATLVQADCLDPQLTMASYGDNKYRMVLDKLKHWDGCLSYIKGAINDDRIWCLVNPDLPTKPVRTPYPREPIRPAIHPTTGQIDPIAMEQYQALLLFREEDLSIFNSEDKALRFWRP